MNNHKGENAYFSFKSREYKRKEYKSRGSKNLQTSHAIGDRNITFTTSDLIIAVIILA